MFRFSSTSLNGKKPNPKPQLTVLKRKLQLALSILQQHYRIKFWHNLYKEIVEYHSLEICKKKLNCPLGVV